MFCFPLDAVIQWGFFVFEFYSLWWQIFFSTNELSSKTDFLAREASASIDLLLLCIIFGFVPKKRLRTKEPYTHRFFHCSNLIAFTFTCCCSYFFHLCCKHARHLLIAKNFFQVSAQSGFYIQSSMVNIMILEHSKQNFTSFKRIVGLLLLQIVFKSDYSFWLVLLPDVKFSSAADWTSSFMRADQA